MTNVADTCIIPHKDSAWNYDIEVVHAHFCFNQKCLASQRISDTNKDAAVGEVIYNLNAANISYSTILEGFMKKTVKKLIAVAGAVAMLGCSAGALAACGPTGSGRYNIQKRDRTGWEDEKSYTYNTFTVTTPSNWNELSNTDANNRDISNWLASAFFEFDFKFDDKGAIVPGGFDVEYSAATKLEDVTATVDSKWGYSDAQKAAGGFAWRITLRDDLKWDDGTAIKASDFVYSMEKQLSPKYRFANASNYYGGNYVFKGAREYAYQGLEDWYASDDVYTTFEASVYDDIVFTVGSAAENATLAVKGDVACKNNVCSFRSSMGIPASFTAAEVAADLAKNGYISSAADLLKLQGKTYTQIAADTELKAIWDGLIGWWQTDPDEELDFFVSYKKWGAAEAESIGIYAEDDTKLVIVLDTQLELLKEDNTLNYEAAYYMSDLPLVHRTKFEANEHAPAPGATLYTSTYNTDVASSASWGPYKLTNYQAGTTYTLSRNDNWYGYGMDQYAKQYQTDQIVCRTVPKWDTAWQDFQKGDIDGIGINVSIADEYRTSKQAYFTPTDFVGSLHVQSSEDALIARNEAGKNRSILAQKDFRKALSLAMDRDDFTTRNTTSSLKGLGFFNSMHYYDVANGGVYRNTDPAKEAILSAYGAEKVEGGWKVGNRTYKDIDDAVDAVTGYNLTLARQLVDSAYEAEKAAGRISDTDKVCLTFGSSEDNDDERRIFNWFTEAFTELVKGTKLEGRLEMEFDGTNGEKWADNFRDGKYEFLPVTGFQGGAWNPYYFIGAEVDNSQSARYCSGWDTTQESLTITVTDAAGKAEEKTFTVQQWHDALNGIAGAPADYRNYPETTKLQILARLEQAALEAYYDIPMMYQFSASLMSYKMDYITYEYNTFMSYGGLRYATYHFDDTEWAAFQAKNGNLNYKP